MEYRVLDHGIEVVESGMGVAAVIASVVVVTAAVVSYLLWRRAEARRLAQVA